MPSENDRIIADLMEQLIESGPDGMASAFIALTNLAGKVFTLTRRASERTVNTCQVEA